MKFIDKEIAERYLENRFDLVNHVDYECLELIEGDIYIVLTNYKHKVNSIIRGNYISFFYVSHMHQNIENRRTCYYKLKITSETYKRKEIILSVKEYNEEDAKILKNNYYYKKYNKLAYALIYILNNKILKYQLLFKAYRNGFIFLKYKIRNYNEAETLLLYSDKIPFGENKGKIVFTIYRRNLNFTELMNILLSYNMTYESNNLHSLRELSIRHKDASSNIEKLLIF